MMPDGDLLTDEPRHDWDPDEEEAWDPELSQPFEWTDRQLEGEE